MKPLRMVLGILPIGLGMLVLSVAAVAQPRASPAPQSEAALRLELGTVFTYFMVMLGPFKLLGPFAQLTHGMDEAAARRLAVKGFGIACLGGLVAAYTGQSLLETWNVSLPALLLAAGLVLLLVALQAVLAQYTSPVNASERSGSSGAEVPQTPAAPPLGLARSLAFPNIITPYGTAALILLLAASPDSSGDLAILGVFLAVMVIDLAAMWFARPILKFGGGPLAVLGAVLGVLQVALAVQLLLGAGHLLGVLSLSRG